MICQYRLTLSLPHEQPVPSYWAYRLYAWLLTQITAEQAEHFHQQEGHPIVGYVSQNCWTVTLFGQDAIALFEGILERTTQIHLHRDQLTVTERQSRRISDARIFLKQGREMHDRKAEIRFLSPAAFKQAGRYTIFPQEKLLVQSLLMRWNEWCLDYPLLDEDMVAELKQGIHIVDYSLRTGRFRLKNATIPCFYGKIILESRLPVVLQELWNALLCFAPYSGIGIKTTLGMGGVDVVFLDKPARRQGQSEHTEPDSRC